MDIAMLLESRNEGPESAQARPQGASPRRAGIHPVEPFAVRLDHRPPSTPSQRLKPPSRPGELHPEPLTDPDLILSHHPARATVRRLPPSVACQVPPVAGGPDPTSLPRSLRSTEITPASSLLRSSPPLSGASVLSASRLEPLAPFPLASPGRFSRSVQEPC